MQEITWDKTTVTVIYKKYNDPSTSVKIGKNLKLARPEVSWSILVKT